MPHLMDQLAPEIERIDQAPAAVETLLLSLMTQLRLITHDSNVHAFAERVTALADQFATAAVKNTPGEVKEEAAAEPEAKPSVPMPGDLPYVPGPISNARETTDGPPAAAPLNDQPPSSPVAPNDAPSATAEGNLAQFNYVAH